MSRWDVELLIDVLTMALDDPKEYPFIETEEYKITQGLLQKLKQLYIAWELEN